MGTEYRNDANHVSSSEAAVQLLLERVEPTLTRIKVFNIRCRHVNYKDVVMGIQKGVTWDKQVDIPRQRIQVNVTWDEYSQITRLLMAHEERLMTTSCCIDRIKRLLCPDSEFPYDLTTTEFVLYGRRHEPIDNRFEEV